MPVYLRSCACVPLCLRSGIYCLLFPVYRRVLSVESFHFGIPGHPTTYSCPHLAPSPVQPHPTDILLYPRNPNPGCFETLKGVTTYGSTSAAAHVLAFYSACVHANPIAADILANTHDWLDTIEHFATTQHPQEPILLNQRPIDLGVQHRVASVAATDLAGPQRDASIDELEAEMRLVEESRRRCQRELGRQRTACMRAASSVLKDLEAFGLRDEVRVELLVVA